MLFIKGIPFDSCGRDDERWTREQVRAMVKWRWSKYNPQNKCIKTVELEGCVDEFETQQPGGATAGVAFAYSQNAGANKKINSRDELSKLRQNVKLKVKNKYL